MTKTRLKKNLKYSNGLFLVKGPKRYQLNTKGTKRAFKPFINHFVKKKKIQ